MELNSTLEQLGLTRQEAIIYIALLKLGIAKASTVAQKAAIQRGAVYYTLKLLKEKGFVSEVVKSGVLYYSAAPPEKLAELIEEDRNKKKQALQTILPELKSLQSTALERPDIAIYEGYEGFKTIFDLLLAHPKKDIRCYLSSKALEYLPAFHEQFRKRRVEKQLPIKTITQKSKLLEEIKQLDKKELRETRFYNELFANTNSLLYILEDSVIIITANSKEQLGIYIQEKSLAQLLRNIFDAQWQDSSKS